MLGMLSMKATRKSLSTFPHCKKLDNLFDARKYTGTSSEFIDAVIESYKSHKNS